MGNFWAFKEGGAFLTKSCGTWWNDKKPKVRLGLFGEKEMKKTSTNHNRILKGW